MSGSQSFIQQTFIGGFWRQAVHAVLFWGPRRDGHTNIVPATVMVHVEGSGAGMNKHRSHLNAVTEGFEERIGQGWKGNWYDDPGWRNWFPPLLPWTTFNPIILLGCPCSFPLLLIDKEYRHLGSSALTPHLFSWVQLVYLVFCLPFSPIPEGP